LQTRAGYEGKKEKRAAPSLPHNIKGGKVEPSKKRNNRSGFGKSPAFPLFWGKRKGEGKGRKRKRGRKKSSPILPCLKGRKGIQKGEMTLKKRGGGGWLSPAPERKE